MTQFLTIARLVLGLLPMLLDAVRAIETAMPASGQGAAKLAIIRSTLEATFNVAGEAVATFDQIWPALEKTVAAVVGVFNTTGVFKKP